MRKKKQQIICLLLIFVMFFCSIIPVLATSEDAILILIDKEDIIPYTYISNSVTSSMNSLVDRTETLKSYYTTSEALDILRSLESTIEDINYSDYIANYNMKHDENNYEKGGFYKYKYSHSEWILRNVLCLMVNNTTSESDLKEMIEIFYRIAKIELANSIVQPDTLNIMVLLLYISDDFPYSIQDFIAFSGLQASYDALQFEDKNYPTDYTMWEKYLAYLDAQKQQEELKQEIIYNNSQVDFITPSEEIKVPDFDESVFDENTINFDISSSYKPEQTMNANDYISRMEETKTVSHTTYKVYEFKNIYYTLDKTETSPVWVNTGISMDTETIDYNKFLNTFSIIARNDGYYYFEDDDMAMLIADGQTLVINKQEEITEDEVETLFDNFEKLGIIVAVRSDEEIDTTNSLSKKVESGELNTISVNGQNLVLTEKPILTKNILQLPTAQVAKALGYKVTESDNNLILAYDITNENGETLNTTIITMIAGSNNYTINENKNSFKTAVTKKNGIIYSEFDKLAEVIGYNYTYNSDTGVLEFNTKN